MVRVSVCTLAFRTEAALRSLVELRPALAELIGSEPLPIGLKDERRRAASSSPASRDCFEKESMALGLG